eukprot:403334720
MKKFVFEKQSLKQIALDLQSKKTTVFQQAEKSFERIMKTKELNYFTYQDPQQMVALLTQAQKAYSNGTNRPLEGILVGVKDNIDIQYIPTTAGSKIKQLQRSGPLQDSSLWHQFRINGAINAGKTNMHELAYGTSGLNVNYGNMLNPHDITRSTGGSSGGSAGLVGSGVLPLALGTDTGGSIRIPAAWCGAVGYRPTINAWPADYGVKCSNIRDSIGPIASSVEDIIFVHEIMTGQKIEAIDKHSNSKLRIGLIMDQYFSDLDPQIENAMNQAIKTLSKQGVEFYEINYQSKSNFQLSEITSKILSYEMPELISSYFQINQKQLNTQEFIDDTKNEDTKTFLQKIFTLKDEQSFYKAINERKIVCDEYHKLFQDNRLDALIYPTCKMMPFNFSELKKLVTYWFRNLMLKWR